MGGGSIPGLLLMIPLAIERKDSMYGNANISPQYVGSSVRSAQPNPESAEGYKLTAGELAKVAIGMKFTLASGDVVNATYDLWTQNLHKLRVSGHISQAMKDGLLELNFCNRSETEGQDDKNKQPNIHFGCYWPPYVQ